MAERTRKQSFMDALMAERIQLPGAPQVIVTRGFAYQFLTEQLGYDKNARGFASVDYMVFRRPEVSAPLTDLTQPHIARLLAFIVETENPKERAA